MLHHDATSTPLEHAGQHGPRHSLRAEHVHLEQLARVLGPLIEQASEGATIAGMSAPQAPVRSGLACEECAKKGPLCGID